jgi:hypothetical protein
MTDVPDAGLRARVRAAAPPPPPLDVDGLARRVRRRARRRRQVSVVAALALLAPVVASLLLVAREATEPEILAPPPAPTFAVLSASPVPVAPEPLAGGPDLDHLPTRLPAGVVRCAAPDADEPAAVTPLDDELSEAVWCRDGSPALRLLTGPHATLPEEKSATVVGVGRRLGYAEVVGAVRRITASDRDSMEDVHLRLEAAAGTPTALLAEVLGSVPALR